MRGFDPLFQEDRAPTKGLVLWKPNLKQGFGDQSPRPSVKMPARRGPAASAAFDTMECVIIKGRWYKPPIKSMVRIGQYKRRLA